MTVSVLHEQAMDLAELAFINRMKGKPEEAKELFIEAYGLEREAAMQLEEQLDAEPTRSILFRSAASLAMNAGDFHHAEKMIAMGLAGDPPEEIAEELRQLILDLYLQRKPDPTIAQVSESHPVPIVLTGRLGYADSTRNRIRLIDEDGRKEPYFLQVEENFYSVIQRFWGNKIKVTGLTWPQTRHIKVEDIEILN